MFDVFSLNKRIFKRSKIIWTWRKKNVKLGKKQCEFGEKTMWFWVKNNLSLGKKRCGFGKNIGVNGEKYM